MVVAVPLPPFLWCCSTSRSVGDGWWHTPYTEPLTLLSPIQVASGGVVLFYYSLILSRGVGNVRADSKGSIQSLVYEDACCEQVGSHLRG